jgi:transposase
VKQCFSGTRILQKQIFVPPYSPQLNAIEECFSKIHTFVDTKQKDDRFELIHLIEQAINTVTIADADAWYRHVMRFLIECAAGKPLKDVV